MSHLWQGKVFTIPGPVLNYEGPDIGGAQFMPVPPPKNLGFVIREICGHNRLRS